MTTECVRPQFVPPSEVEASSYYFGLLVTTPRLVGRLSYQVFDPSNIKHKQIFTMGRHELREKLDQEDEEGGSLRKEILAALEPLKWQSVDYVRIGYEGEEAEAKPTMLIILFREDERNLADVQVALEKIWDACAAKGICDLEIEIMG